MPKLPECDRCRCYARSCYLVCAIHPDGVEGERCPDFAPSPNAESAAIWEPVGASYYNGVLITQPQQVSPELQIEMLDTHPLFTGRCPECEMTIIQTGLAWVHWDCPSCEWKDDSI